MQLVGVALLEMDLIPMFNVEIVIGKVSAKIFKASSSYPHTRDSSTAGLV